MVIIDKGVPSYDMLLSRPGRAERRQGEAASSEAGKRSVCWAWPGVAGRRWAWLGRVALGGAERPKAN